MDDLKVIPQAFYDLISRIIPGITAIFFLTFALGKKIGELPVILFGDSPNVLSTSIVILLIVGLVTSYLIGHIVALLSDIFEKKVAKRMFSSYFDELFRAMSGNSIYPKTVRDFLESEVDPKSNDEKRVAQMIFLWYDWLRVHQHEAGARCAKMRAEYRMHAGIAVIMILTIIIHLLSVALYHINFNTNLIAMSSILCLLFLWAHARMHRMFEWSVINQFFTAKH